VTLRLYVATTNAGKLRDFALAEGGNVEITPMPGLGSIPAPEEDEETFEGNARLKAIYYSRFVSGEIVIADDSGLEVDVLGGAPGVRSARYAEDAGYLANSGLLIDDRNNRCLIAALSEVAEVDRRSRYRCVLVAATDGKVVAVGVGTVEGVVLTRARGSGGFGYDPYFAPEGLDQSMAELTPQARLALSHRARALRDLLPKLTDVARMLTQ
jgi:XTP/dITP diphosphohydrolase